MAEDRLDNNDSLIWSIAEILRGDFKQSQYGRVVLPFTVLRRLDCLLEETKDAVRAAASDLPEETDETARFTILAAAADAGGQIYNDSAFTFDTLKAEDAGQLREN